MMRKNLQSEDDLNAMPSLLGHYFRQAVHGEDTFNYNQAVAKTSLDEKLQLWTNCRNKMGMHTPPDPTSKERQQYMD